MQNQEERDCNGIRVETRMLPPMRAYRLLARLGKLLPTIARTLTPESLVRIKAGDIAAAMPVAMTVFGSLDDLDAAQLALDVLRGSSVYQTGDKGAVRRVDLTSEDFINAAFEGNLKALLGSIMFALEVNFRDFFPVPAQGASTTQTPSPSGSTPT